MKADNWISSLKEDFFANTEKPFSWATLAIELVHDPGLYTITMWRVANRLYTSHVVFRPVGVLLWRWLILTTGCHISLKAKLGRGLRLPHPIGVVIGAFSVVGNNVTIYHHVTIGRACVSSNEYPRVGDNVTVYVGACVIGEIDVGDGAIVGANSVVTADVASATTVGGIPAKVLVR